MARYFPALPIFRARDCCRSCDRLGRTKILRRPWRDIFPLSPFFALGIVAAVVTVWVEQKFCADHGEIFNFSIIDRCLIAGRLFWFYLGKIFWPANLSLIYSSWTIDSSTWWQY